MENIFYIMFHFSFIEVVSVPPEILLFLVFIDRFSLDIMPDIMTLLQDSSPSVPILMIHDKDISLVVKRITDFAADKGIQYMEVYLSDDGPLIEQLAMNKIHTAMSEVGKIC